MKKSAKLLSLLLSLAMVFSLSTAVLAADSEVTLGTARQKPGNACIRHAGFRSVRACPCLR